MMRKLIAIGAGLVLWFLVALLAGFIIRATWPAYVSVAEAMTFTLPMKIARLAISAVATVAMGFLTARITRSAVVSLIPGIILLAVFIPEHVTLWNKFPVWYHLWFLLTLVPLTYLGNWLARGAMRERPVESAKAY
ncbi:MAG TPA: hypothetical protein VFS47_17450 [Steroidobacteraceae bacterium]|nr:hypothetical protein [Steroidobacteraceae bacterium]